VEEEKENERIEVEGRSGMEMFEKELVSVRDKSASEGEINE
jgi:hypothetical protein